MMKGILYLLLCSLMMWNLVLGTPDRILLSNKYGIVGVPSNIRYEYSSTYRLTIGVRLDVIPGLEMLMTEYNGWCKLKDLNRERVWEKYQWDLTNYTLQLKKSLDYKNQKVTDLVDYELPKREKRGLISATAMAIGISSMGFNLYEWLWDDDEEHFLVQRQIQSLGENLNKFSDKSQQYKLISHRLFLKLYHGITDQTLALRQGFCTSAMERDLHLSSLLFSITLEKFKADMHQALSGTVTEFLLTPDFIEKELLIQPEFLNSLYREDRIALYRLSTSMLIDVNLKTQIASFDIIIPIVEKNQLSVVYSITNLGWSSSLDNLKARIPRFIYSRHEDPSEVLSFDPNQCKQFGDGYLCHQIEAISDEASICIREILEIGSVNTCYILRSNSSNRCTYRILVGGVAIRGCPIVQLTEQSVSGFSLKMLHLPMNGFLYLRFDQFYSIRIGKRDIYSHRTHFRVTTNDLPVDLKSLIVSSEPEISTSTWEELQQLASLIEKEDPKWHLPVMISDRFIFWPTIGCVLAILTILFVVIIYKKKSKKTVDVTPITYHSPTRPIEI